ncbi:MAG: VOC family protein [bacterium]
MSLINQILETALYVRDIEEAATFYENLFDVKMYARNGERHVFFKIGQSMLLLFNANESKKSGSLPPHGMTGAGHVAFVVEHHDLDFWRRRLKNLHVKIEREKEWPSGGKSIYFRDPSGNLLELVTPDTWL